MVSRGKARGGGKQLFNYMLGKGENEKVELLFISGTIEQHDPYKALKEFEIAAQMSGSKKPFYHGQISPAYEESLRLKDDDYVDMVQIHAKHMEFPKNVMAMGTAHYKNGHKHIHYALLRHDFATGNLVSDSMDYYKRRHADMEIEKKYDLAKTPFRNPKRAEYKKDASEAYSQSKSGQEFVEAMKAKGYTVAMSVKEKKPLRLIDAAGTSSNLLRKIEGFSTKEVRDRLKDVKLPLDTEVIQSIRQRQQEQQRMAQVENTARQEARNVTAKEIDPEERRRKFMEQFQAKGRNKERGYER